MEVTEVLWLSYSRSRLSSPANTLPLMVVSGVRWIDLQNIDYNLGAYITNIYVFSVYSCMSDVKFLNTPSSSSVRGFPSRLLHVCVTV